MQHFRSSAQVLPGFSNCLSFIWFGRRLSLASRRDPDDPEYIEVWVSTERPIEQ